MAENLGWVQKYGNTVAIWSAIFGLALSLATVVWDTASTLTRLNTIQVTQKRSIERNTEAINQFSKLALEQARQGERIRQIHDEIAGLRADSKKMLERVIEILQELDGPIRQQGSQNIDSTEGMSSRNGPQRRDKKDTP